jgi:ABC-type oligopeptide transport system ATPase subunit
MSGQIVFTGNRIKAKYKEQQQAMYKHNPFIESLPPVLDFLDVASRISRRPAYSEEERKLPPLQRIHAVQTIANFVDPLPMHFDLESRFSRMIRNGYMARNPIKAEWKRQMRSGFPDLDWGDEHDDYEPLIRSTASGFAIIGPSGIGKTTSIESILGLYPQIIEHTEYNGTPLDYQQLVWLKLDCPQDGRIKGLCLNFFQSVDKVLKTKYYQKYSRGKVTVDVLLPEIGKLAFALGLGVLVIDEIQRLMDAEKGGANKVMNAFVQLVNTIGVPVVTVGTYKALKLFEKEFAMARRAAGQGDMFYSNFVKDEIWEDFIESLWEYQWTSEETPLTPALNKALYEESQGIIDIAIKIYMIAQWYVIGEESEKITVGLIRQVAKENFRLAKPMLDALKTGDTELLASYSDVSPTSKEMEDYLKRAAEKVTLSGVVNTLRNQTKSSKTSSTNGEKSPLLMITQWLVDAEIEPNIARECAHRAIELYATDNNLKKAMNYAYQQAMELSLQKEEQEDEIETSSTKKRKKKSNRKIEDSEIKDIIFEDHGSIDDLISS